MRGIIEASYLNHSLHILKWETTLWKALIKEKIFNTSNVYLQDNKLTLTCSHKTLKLLTVPLGKVDIFINEEFMKTHSSTGKQGYSEFMSTVAR